MKTIVSEFYEGYLFVCLTDRDPSDEEWELVVRLHEKHGAAIRAVVVFTDGGGPDARQRRRISPYLKQSRTAVVTASLVARRIMTALSWFGLQGARAFSPGETDEALTYLGADAAMKARLLEKQRELTKLLKRQVA